MQCLFSRYQSIESGKHAECEFESEFRRVRLRPNKITSTSLGWLAFTVNSGDLLWQKYMLLYEFVLWTACVVTLIKADNFNHVM